MGECQLEMPTKDMYVKRDSISPRLFIYLLGIPAIKCPLA